MKECRRNIELFYLLGKLAPDFRTIADFRKDNATALKNTFKAFSKLCLKLDLFEKELLAVDGTKIRAVNSKDNCYNESVLKKKISTSKVPKKKVVLRIPEEKELLKQRKCLSEHPFGTVKWYHGAHYLLCKGIEKASAEMGLAFLSYNMTRAINMVGIKKIIAAI